MTHKALHFLLVISGLCYQQTASQRVIWECDNFPADGPFDGDCNWNRGNIQWGEDHIEAVPDPDGGSSDVVRILYPEGSYAGLDGDEKGGTQFYSEAFGSYDRVVFQYQVYFSENFDFVEGGKLPGLYGGEDQCSGGVYNNCFSTRFHWREEGTCELYAYIPNHEDVDFCGDPGVICDFRFGHSFGRGTFQFERSVWHTIAMDIQLNDVGEMNGAIRLFFDGEQVFEYIGLEIRVDNSIMIDNIYFSTFFGGSSDIRFASSDDVYTHFRQFQILVFD